MLYVSFLGMAKFKKKKKKMDQTKREREISIRFFARLSSARRCFRDLSRTSEAPSCWASKRGSSLLLTVKTRKKVLWQLKLI